MGGGDIGRRAYLTPVDRRQALRSTLVVGVAVVAGALIPLAPFIVLPAALGIWAAILVFALVLFIVGAYKARLTVGHPGRSGLEMAILGTLSALVGYGIGVLLKVPATP